MPKEFIKKNLHKIIEKEVKSFIHKTTKKRVKAIKILNFWIVRQYKNEYNPVHYHDGHLSAVGYLKVPKNLNKSKKQVKTNGTIDFINGSKNFLCESIHTRNAESQNTTLPINKPIILRDDNVLLFPNYLMHTAYPFNVEGERRSFSLNIQLDQKVTNIFHD